MKVKILDAKPWGTNIKVRLQFLDASSVVLGEREYDCPFKVGMTVAQGKNWLS